MTAPLLRFREDPSSVFLLHVLLRICLSGPQRTNKLWSANFRDPPTHRDTLTLILATLGGKQPLHAVNLRPLLARLLEEQLQHRSRLVTGARPVGVICGRPLPCSRAREFVFCTGQRESAVARAAGSIRFYFSCSSIRRFAQSVDDTVCFQASCGCLLFVYYHKKRLTCRI